MGTMFNLLLKLGTAFFDADVKGGTKLFVIMSCS
jgi:hypothetical protein